MKTAEPEERRSSSWTRLLPSVPSREFLSSPSCQPANEEAPRSAADTNPNITQCTTRVHTDVHNTHCTPTHATQSHSAIKLYREMAHKLLVTVREEPETTGRHRMQKAAVTSEALVQLSSSRRSTPIPLDLPTQIHHVLPVINQLTTDSLTNQFKSN